MTRAISIIKHEHRNLGAVLCCLDALVDEIEHHESVPDFRVFHAILDYLDGFLNRFHHPKEDEHLFPALRRRYPECDALLAGIEAEHREVGTLLAGFREALAAYEHGGAESFPAFRDTVRAYVEFELRHAHTEEREVLPLARERLEAQDWEQIEAAFQENRDPLFGDEPAQAFISLYKVIANLAPAPYGTGPEWKRAPRRPGS